MMDFRVRLIPDNYHLLHVGRLGSGAQFWIDVQLRGEADTTRDFVATYIFNEDGVLSWHEIIDLGLRSNPGRRAATDVILAQIAKLGPSEKADISVFPFSVDAYGSTFGLVVRESDTDDPSDIDDCDGPLVDALPGWTLMFYPPWGEGLYDT